MFSTITELLVLLLTLRTSLPKITSSSLFYQLFAIVRLRQISPLITTIHIPYAHINNPHIVFDSLRIRLLLDLPLPLFPSTFIFITSLTASVSSLLVIHVQTISAYSPSSYPCRRSLLFFLFSRK